VAKKKRRKRESEGRKKIRKFSVVAIRRVWLLSGREDNSFYIGKASKNCS
jgi:hypothetical protein